MSILLADNTRQSVRLYYAQVAHTQTLVSSLPVSSIPQKDRNKPRHPLQLLFKCRRMTERLDREWIRKRVKNIDKGGESKNKRCDSGWRVRGSLEGLKNRMTHVRVFYLLLWQDKKFSSFTEVTMQLFKVIEKIIESHHEDVLAEGTYAFKI